MPAPYGLTLDGLNVPILQEIRDDINAKLWELISPTLDVSDRSLEGHIAGIVAEALSRVWEVAEAGYAAMDRDKATGSLLDAVCVLTGTTRRPATASAVTLALIGVATSVVPAGSIARVPDGPRFETRDDAEIEALDAWVAATAYVAGDKVTHGGRAYQYTVDGVSHAADGPTSTDKTEDAADGTAELRYLGEGTGAVDALGVATEAGALSANAGTITEIVTAVGGWVDVSNVLDASVGRERMLDPDLRALAELELAKPGTGTPDAIRAALLDVEGVFAATVFCNRTSHEDDDGMPPHSIEAMVRGGEDQDIWQCLWDNVAGLETHGIEEGTVVDSEGTEQTVRFSRPEEIPIYAALVIVVDPDTFPADGEAQIKEAIAAWGNAQANGKNAVPSAVTARAFDIDGVLEVISVALDIAPAPVATATIPIGKRQLAVWDRSRITIDMTEGEP